MAASSESNKPSSFLIDIANGNFTNQLRIPPDFARKLNGLARSFPQKFSLSNSTSGCWIVEINKSNNDLYFQKGWREFVEDNSLESGDFLVFKYHGCQKFIVDIYGKNRCDKEGGLPREVIELDPSSESEDMEEVTLTQDAATEDDDDVEIMGTDEESQDETIGVGENFPTSVACLRRSYLRNGRMRIPKLFNRFVHKNQIVKLQSTNETCSARVVAYPSGYMLSSGWTKFEKANNFKQGDMLQFQLIHKEEDVTFAISLLK